MVILSILALGVGHRVSIALRLSRYQKDSLKALCLAKVGLNLAIEEIDKNKDLSSYDVLKDNWADNKEKFEKIMLNENKNEFAIVSYNVGEVGKEEAKYGVLDEESKINININTASPYVFRALLESCGVVAGDSVDTLANNICAWRGDSNAPEEAKDYKNLGYECKGKSLVNNEELGLIKGIKEIEEITPDIYNKIKGLITVHGDGLVNINTVNDEVLKILLNACVKELNPSPEINSDSLLKKIREAGVFKKLDDFKNVFDLNEKEVEVIDKLQKLIKVRSNCFRIISVGKIANIGLERVIECVYDRNAKKVIWQHER